MKTKLTLGSLFDGSGGFPMAGLLNGITPIWASEIEPYPIRVTKEHLPYVKHYGDVSKINGASIEPVDIITFGSPCFPAGTLVNTDNGYKPIERLTVFDKVLTHSGAYRKVLDIKCTGRRKLYEVKGMAFDSIRATPNHRFLVRHRDRKWNNDKRMYDRVFSKANWVELKDIIRGDYVGTPVIQTETNPLNLSDEECLLLGRYIADGYTIRGKEDVIPNRILFTIGNGKQRKFEQYFDLYQYTKAKLDHNVQRYSISNRRLGQLCESCGRGAENKHFPQFLLDLPVEKLKLVIEGYMDGDGCYSQNRFKATSVSRKLVYSLGAAIAKAFHSPYSIYRVPVPIKTAIENRIVNQKTQYQICFKKEQCKQDKAFYEDGYIWSPINEVLSTMDKELVYDITVDIDHSFCVSNIAVHNCQDLSIAGARKGLHDGERSSLFFQAIRIIEQMRNATGNKYPRFLVWENVPGAFSSNKGNDFKSVLEAIGGICENGLSIPRPKKWGHAGSMVGNGWSVAWRVYDAQYWGVPQRRKRIYLVADLAGECADKILFKSKGMSGDFEPGRKAWERIAYNSERSVDRSCFPIDAHQQDARFSLLPSTDPTPTLSQKMGTGGNNTPMVLEKGHYE